MNNQQQSNTTDLFGGNNDLMGGGFGGGMDTTPFPSYIAYEDDAICLGWDLKRESGNSYLITAHFKNKSSFNMKGVNMQVAA